MIVSSNVRIRIYVWLEELKALFLGYSRPVVLNFPDIYNA